MDMISELGRRFRTEFLGRGISVIAGGLLILSLSRLLGPDLYGLLFLAISVFTIIEMFAKLGIAKAAARYISEYKEKSPDQLRHIIKISLLYNIIVLSIVSIIYLATYRYIAAALNEPELVPLLLLGILYLIFGSLNKYTRLILQGFEAIEESAIVHGTNQVLRLFFAVGFVLLGFGAIGALWGYVISFFATSIIGLGFILFRYYLPFNPAPNVEEGLQKRIAEYMVPLTATNAANIIDKQIDTVLIGFFLSPAAVGFYVLAKQIFQFVVTPAGALGFTLSPTLASERSAGNNKQASRLYEKSLIYSLLLYLPAAVGLIIIAPSMIELIFGPAYRGATRVLQILCVFLVFVSITMVTSNALDFLGRARDRAIYKGITSIMNAILNVILIPVMGIEGAAIATVITYSIYTSMNIYIMHDEIGIRIGYVIENLLLIITVSGLMAIPVFLASIYIQGILTLFLTVLLGIVIWLTINSILGYINAETISKIMD